MERSALLRSLFSPPSSSSFLFLIVESKFLLHGEARINSGFRSLMKDLKVGKHSTGEDERCSPILTLNMVEVFFFPPHLK